MFKNVYFDTRKSVIHLWEQYNNENMYTEIPWCPYVFKKNNKGNIKTINGISVVKKEFENYQEYKTYQKNNSDVFENKTRPDIQFLAEKYHGIKDDEIKTPNLKVYYLDIEVDYVDEFPTPIKAKDPVSLITIYDNTKNKSITWGTKPCNIEYKYIQCDNEKDLLKQFFNYMKKYPCDVLSGWNLIGFDLYYLVNRCKKVFGVKTNVYKKMSPINNVRLWNEDKKFFVKIDIAGVTTIDYDDIYKRYSRNKLESYKLDFVSNFELGKGKIDYSEYSDLKELYKKDFNKYVEYNIIDCKRIFQLEEKLGYINLVQSLSLLCKSPMKHFQATTSLIEGYLMTGFRRNGLCAPIFKGGEQKTFQAAIVKTPTNGFVEWIFSLDIASSYPTAIITLNISPEMLFGRILNLSEEKILYCVRNGKFESFEMQKNNEIVKMKGDKLDKFNAALKRKLFSIAPCGSIFLLNKEGIFSKMERNLFAKRKEVKKRKFELENAGGSKIEVQRLDAFQLALKILLNSLFGITSVPYSRYMCMDVAEAITACGRHTIRSGEKFVNEILNNPTKEFSDIFKDLK